MNEFKLEMVLYDIVISLQSHSYTLLPKCLYRDIYVLEEGWTLGEIFVCIRYEER